MTRTWLARATVRIGPSWKQGYPSATSRTLAEIEGEVKHSAEGSLAGLFGELDRPDRTASWHFSIAKADGGLFQHYPLEAICWHCGLPGDRRQDTSLIGNVTLIGEEHEGGGPGNYGEPLTEPQYQSSLYVTEEVRRLCLRVGANPPTLRLNLYEHRWLSWTSCPSDRIPWQRLIADLKEDDMAFTEEDHRMLQTVHHMAKIVVPAEHAWISKQLKALETSNNARFVALRKQIAAIETGGSGASPAQVLAMAKKALKEGSG